MANKSYCPVITLAETTRILMPIIPSKETIDDPSAYGDYKYANEFSYWPFPPEHYLGDFRNRSCVWCGSKIYHTGMFQHMTPHWASHLKMEESSMRIPVQLAEDLKSMPGVASGDVRLKEFLVTGRRCDDCEGWVCIACLGNHGYYSSGRNGSRQPWCRCYESASVVIQSKPGKKLVHVRDD
jgi:hypothetical protein